MEIIKGIIKKFQIFFEKIEADHVGEYTAQCAYYTFLSFIPFIILLLSFIKYINIETDTLARIFTAILPSIMKDSVLDIIQEMYSKSFETISISAIFMLWSASKNFYALTKGFHSIYNKEDAKENYIILRLKALLGAAITLIFIIAILILLVFGNTIEQSINENFQRFSGVLEFIINTRKFISIAILFTIFLFMYRFMQNKGGRKFKNCILGASFSAIAWYLISFFFSIYVDIFTSFSIIYGSLATITLIMMWLYTVIYVIFLGAEINIITEGKIQYLLEKLRKTKRLKKAVEK